jgi:hypothetical protein
MGDMKKRRNRLVEWMIDWDKRHWGHDFVGSSTLGIATIFIAALAGMVLTILEGGFDDVFFVYAVMLILVVVIESVLSAKSVKTAVGRSLVMSFAVSLAMLAMASTWYGAPPSRAIPGTLPSRHSPTTLAVRTSA